MGRHVIIGDVHGMLVELHTLINIIQPTSEDVVVFCGDLLDKGPDSPGVVCFARELKTRTGVILTKGNHEEKHERFRKAFASSPEGASKFKNSEELRRITEALSPEDVAFLNSAVLFHKIPEHNALVVHAGILPDMKNLPTPAEWTAMSRGEQEKFNRVLRVRHVTGRATTKLTVEINFPFEVTHPEDAMADGRWTDFAVTKTSVRPQGSFVALGEEQEGDPFWAEGYDGRFGHVYFGHNPYDRFEVPVEFPQATGLDLGCVFGGRLAAAVLETGKPVSYVTVKASRGYAQALWEE
jgi:hypothetical protein